MLGQLVGMTVLAAAKGFAFAHLVTSDVNMPWVIFPMYILVSDYRVGTCNIKADQLLQSHMVWLDFLNAQLRQKLHQINAPIPLM